MKKLIMTAILATVFVAGMAFNASPTSATYQDPNKCYEEVTIYGDIIEKETRTKTSSDRGETWSEYGPWTDWPDAGPVNDDGRNRGPAFHGEDNQGKDRWYRQYRYVVKGQFVKGTEMQEVPCPTIPETTVPETTIPETTVPETTVPETTAPPTTISEQCPDVDGVHQYPQSYDDDAPCGPTDPCVGINPETGMGTTLWNTQPCGTPVTTVPAPTVPPSIPPTLPSTGTTGAAWSAIIGVIALALGTGAVKLSRRKS